FPPPQSARNRRFQVSGRIVDRFTAFTQTTPLGSPRVVKTSRRYTPERHPPQRRAERASLARFARSANRAPRFRPCVTHLTQQESAQCESRLLRSARPVLRVVVLPPRRIT